MDLRVVKTQKSIRDAYLQEKKKKPLSNIKVTDICATALINKTTFYKHFQDIYALADAIESDLIVECLQQCEFISCLFTNTHSFSFEIIKVFLTNKEKIDLVFDTRYDVILTKIENYLLNLYLKGSQTTRQATLIRFCIGGAFHILLYNFLNEQTNEVVELLVDIIEKVNIRL